MVSLVFQVMICSNMVEAEVVVWAEHNTMPLYDYKDVVMDYEDEVLYFITDGMDSTKSKHRIYVGPMRYNMELYYGIPQYELVQTCQTALGKGYDNIRDMRISLDKKNGKIYCAWIEERTATISDIYTAEMDINYIKTLGVPLGPWKPVKRTQSKTYIESFDMKFNQLNNSLYLVWTETTAAQGEDGYYGSLKYRSSLCVAELVTCDDNGIPIIDPEKYLWEEKRIGTFYTSKEDSLQIPYRYINPGLEIDRVYSRLYYKAGKQINDKEALLHTGEIAFSYGLNMGTLQNYNTSITFNTNSSVKMSFNQKALQLYFVWIGTQGSVTHKDPILSRYPYYKPEVYPARAIYTGSFDLSYAPWYWNGSQQLVKELTDSSADSTPEIGIDEINQMLYFVWQSKYKNAKVTQKYMALLKTDGTGWSKREILKYNGPLGYPSSNDEKDLKETFRLFIEPASTSGILDPYYSFNTFYLLWNWNQAIAKPSRSLGGVVGNFDIAKGTVPRGYIDPMPDPAILEYGFYDSLEEELYPDYPEFIGCDEGFMEFGSCNDENTEMFNLRDARRGSR